MRKGWLGLGVVTFLLPIGCSSNGGSSSGFDSGSSKSSGGSSSSSGGSGSSGAAGSSSGGAGLALPAAPGGGFVSGGVASSSGGEGSADAGAPGVLTAGIWDDNLNYTFFGNYLATKTSIAGDPGFTKAEYDASQAEFATRSPHTVLDAALVIDTTGSMADEIAYLTAEFANITKAIASSSPGADQRWALVLYRDRPETDPGDAYVVEAFDFTASADEFASRVGAQSADGGGDTPEAPELGLAKLPQLTWRTDPSVAKVAFWIGDAPQHAAYAADMKSAILGAHTAGIHLYPVSASGADDLLELTMRSAAEITGGRYLFLTDDSGIGNPHKKPEIPCYFVTTLEKALVRTVSMELSGAYIGPNLNDVIRTFGDPSTSGECTTQDGQTVAIF